MTKITDNFKYATYDVEIKNLIPSNNQIDPNYTYCRGWTDYLGMGISKIGLYVDEKPEIFDNVEDFGKRIDELQKNGYYIGGFNNYRFDDKIIQAHGYPINSNYDLYKWIREHVGYFTSGYSLGEIAELNGLNKNGDGADAPKLYQDNEIVKLEEYLINDLHITYQLVKKSVDGTLIL